MKLKSRISVFQKMSRETKTELILNFTLNNYKMTSDKTERLVHIVQKPHHKRSPDEAQVLVHLIREMQFFKNRKEISPYEIKEVSQVFAFQNTKAGRTVIRFGEYGEHFFIILAGQVSVSIPNPIIRDWKDHFRRFQALKEWRNTVFKARRR